MTSSLETVKLPFYDSEKEKKKEYTNYIKDYNLKRNTKYFLLISIIYWALYRS